MKENELSIYYCKAISIVKFEDLYNENIGLWPEEIDLSDGYSVGNNGYMFPTLNAIYDNIEDGIDHKNDCWRSLFCWATSRAFHTESKLLKSMGISRLLTRDVDKIKIDRFIRENLKEESWQTEANSYQGL